MFGELGFIDWIALAFAALLLAGAAAAAVLAYMTNRANMATSHGAPPPPTGPAVTGPDAPAAAQPTVHAPQHAKAPIHEVAIDLREGSVGDTDVRTHRPMIKTATPVVSRATPEPVVTAEAKLAARAARLRGRPVVEPATDARKRVVSAVEPERTPAHAKTVAYAADYRTGEAHERSTSKGFPARTPGFFEDPLGRHELRYWDGARWTEYVKEHGERFTDPL